MVLRKISYIDNGEKKEIYAEVCDTALKKFTGLMFKKNPKPLFFTFNREKKISIHSLFCKPFRAIWLDKNFRKTGFIDAKPWRFNYSGHGKYLLEVPFKLFNNSKTATENNRKV